MKIPIPIKILLLVIASKLLLLCFSTFFYGFKHKPIPEISSIFKQNDSWWYEKIAVSGHQKISYKELTNPEKQSYYGFMPFYPAIVGVVIKLTGVSFNLVAYWLSFLFTYLCLFSLFTFSNFFFNDEKKAWYTILLFIAFPFHYFYSVYYTEALFLSMLMASFICIRKEKYILLGLLTSCMVLTRPTGLVLLLPLFIYAIENGRFSQLKDYWKTILTLALPVLTMVCYCIYLKSMTGDFFAYSTAQAFGWQKHIDWPWKAFLASDRWQIQVNSVYTIIFSILTFFAVKKMPLSLKVLSWTCIIFPLCTGLPYSLPRYLSIAFPVFLFLGEKLSKTKFRKSIVLTLFAIQLWTFYFWLIADSFSF